MSGARSWQDVRAEVTQRVRDGFWRPGDLIPAEAELAAEFGCARATVNRALQSLAADGLLERRRRAGTRVAAAPTARAEFRVPFLRAEIEATGAVYAHTLLARGRHTAPQDVAVRMSLPSGAVLWRLRALHRADGAPYAYEDRWINAEVVPDIDTVDFTTLSANEYLLRNVPITTGQLDIASVGADGDAAQALATDPDEPLLEMLRTTWLDDRAVTTVRLLFRPGHRLTATL